MEKSISKLLTPNILQDAMMRIGTLLNSYHLIGEMEKFVLRCIRCDQPIFLRITHVSHRIYNQIIRELDWIRCLSKSGETVPKDR